MSPRSCAVRAHSAGAATALGEATLPVLPLPRPDTPAARWPAVHPGHPARVPACPLPGALPTRPGPPLERCPSGVHPYWTPRTAPYGVKLESGSALQGQLLDSIQPRYVPSCAATTRTAGGQRFFMRSCRRRRRADHSIDLGAEGQSPRAPRALARKRLADVGG